MLSFLPAPLIGLIASALLALNTLFFNEDGGMVAKLSDSSNVGILVFLVMLGILGLAKALAGQLCSYPLIGELLP